MHIDVTDNNTNICRHGTASLNEFVWLRRWLANKPVTASWLNWNKNAFQVGKFHGSIKFHSYYLHITSISYRYHIRITYILHPYYFDFISIPNHFQITYFLYYIHSLLDLNYANYVTRVGICEAMIILTSYIVWPSVQ